MFSEAGDQKPSRATSVEIMERVQGGGKRRRLNVLVRNLSWNDRKQSYCWKRARGMTRVGWNPAHSVCACVCVDGEGKLGWTAVREPVSRDV